MPNQTVNASAPAFLFEIAWEVCQQLGGIYTVIRSKAPAMVERWGKQYCLVGPYNPVTAAVEFEPAEADDLHARVIQELRRQGYGVHYGYWLVTGRPRVMLLETQSALRRLDEFKYFLWEHHHIATNPGDEEMNQVLAFGLLTLELFRALERLREPAAPRIIAHFHEWMGAVAIPEMRRDKLQTGIVFTTHATLLGRYLAMSDQRFYDHLSFVNWRNDARRFNIEERVLIERAAAHGAHVFTTVSDVTATECAYLLGRKPDAVLPNGLNVERFIARHESENLHKVYKEHLHRFVTSHFFPSYSFDLDRTLYFFTSGRYEYRNKGFDLTLEALARLNYRLKQARKNITVVLFIISRRPFRSMIAEVLNNKAMTDELYHTCMTIKDTLGERLFKAAAMGQMPDLNMLMDEYWRLRLRRSIQACRSAKFPAIVTHDLIDQEHDEVLNQLRGARLINHADDPVKIVYHPDFIATTNPLFSMDYDQFVRGCHLGLFPSYYEPWGYTPLECLARGIPAVTSDLSGFGSHIISNLPDCRQKGLYFIKRRNASFHKSADDLADILMRFIDLELRERIAMRFHAQELAEHFDWKQLIRFYHDAHQRLLQ